MNIFEIIMRAPFCVVGLLLYSFTATFQEIKTKTWFFPLFMAVLSVFLGVSRASFSGELPVENASFSLLIFNMAVFLIALSLYHFKKTQGLAVVNAVSFVLSAGAIVSLYPDYGLPISYVCMGLAVVLELAVWFFIAQTRVKVVNPETGSVLLLVGNVATAVMVIAFFIAVFLRGRVYEPTELYVVNAMCAAFLCRFLLTRIYLCVRTLYRVRNN
jgi:hypothetical protein